MTEKRRCAHRSWIRRARLAVQQAEREQRATARRDELRVAHEAITAGYSACGPLDDPFDDELDVASNAVIDLIEAGKFDEAEATARDLLVGYSDMHDGWDRLGMV